MSAPRVVLFDVLGTLVEDPFYERMPAFLGMTLDELIASKTPEAWPRFERGEIDEPEFFRTFFADGREFDHQGLKRVVVEGWAWLPGVEAVLRDLSAAGVPCHGLSNYPVWMRELDAKLGLTGHLGELFVSYLLGVRKPRPDAFERTLDTLGLAAREVLFIDDQPDNVAAARELGLHAHRFSGADRLRAELDAAGLLPSAG